MVSLEVNRSQAMAHGRRERIQMRERGREGERAKERESTNGLCVQEREREREGEKMVHTMTIDQTDLNFRAANI